MTLRKPMLADPVERGQEHLIRLPVLASPKIDGIRATVTEQKFLSRSGKPFKNKKILTIYGHVMDLLNDLDGEWASGSPCAFNCMQATTSCVNSYENSTDELCYYVFDIVMPNMPAIDRYAALTIRVNSIFDAYPGMINRIKIVEKKIINTLEELDAYEEEMLHLGYEGIMIQGINTNYKHGRGSIKSQELLKIKRFCDSEAKITGFYEGHTNLNEEELDAYGHTTRASKKEFIVPTGTLGGFLATDIHTGQELRIGSGRGLTHELRDEIFNNQDKYIGKLVKYKFFKVGSVNTPRFPIYIGFRDPDDLGGE